MPRDRTLTLVAFLTTIGALAGPTGAAEPNVETGSINGAAFRIEVPAGWNRSLVMYCHGYRIPGAPVDPEGPPAKAFREVFLGRGFALAESEYSGRGWAVKEGVEDTEALRRYFGSRYGAPRETYVTGHSMGGVITVATVERYPELYAGAMPLCGPLSPALDFFEDRVFDMLVVFEHYFPGSVASPVDVPADFQMGPAAEKAKAAVASKPETAAMFARRYQLKVADLPGVLAFWQVIMRELVERADGNPFDNRNTIYAGFDDDLAVNRGVKRYAASPEAVAYLRRYYTPTGRPSRPVLTVQTVYDQLVTARDVSYYDVLTAIAGQQDLFVQKFVQADGHCNIAPPRVGAAFDELLGWLRDRKRPTPGEIP